MIARAFEVCAPWLTPPVRQRVKEGWVQEAQEYRAFLRELAAPRSAGAWRLYVIQRLLAGSAAAHQHVRTLPVGLASWRESFPTAVRDWLEATGVGPILSPVRLPAPNASASHQAPSDARISA